MHWFSYDGLTANRIIDEFLFTEKMSVVVVVIPISDVCLFVCLCALQSINEFYLIKKFNERKLIAYQVECVSSDTLMTSVFNM